MDRDLCADSCIILSAQANRFEIIAMAQQQHYLLVYIIITMNISQLLYSAPSFSGRGAHVAAQET